MLAIVFIHEETSGGKGHETDGDRMAQTPNPTRMGCKAEHTDVLQTSPLTAFFIHLKERKSTAKAIAQRHHSAPATVGWNISHMWHPPSGKLEREQGCPTPLWTAAPTSSHWTQMAGESNTSGATPTHSHLVPAVDSASSRQQVNNEIQCSPVFLLQARMPEMHKKLA